MIQSNKRFIKLLNFGFHLVLLLIVGNLRKIFIDLDRAHYDEERNPSSIFTYLQKKLIPRFWRGDF